jgi:hypothetical protein
MKYVLLAIFVLFAAQPLQASPYDMCDGQNSGHSQHGDMLDSDMNDMDCCDDDPVDSGDGCGSMSHCGACTAGVTAINPSVTNAIFSTSSRQHSPDTGDPLNRFNPPPFRPPIV